MKIIKSSNDTPTEKDLLQAKHRVEEAQARDRAKENSKRTHRLIQKGAILEKAIPEAKDMSPTELQEYLYTLIKYRTTNSK